jgi:hypothetical protein
MTEDPGDFTDTSATLGTEWQDTDGDHIFDTELVDLDGDGHTDLQFDSFDENGTSHHLLVDENADGVADIEVLSSFGEEVDEGGSGPFAVTDYETDVPGAGYLSGDTAALVGNINGMMADAVTQYDAALDPSSVTVEDLDASTSHIHDASAAAASLQGSTAAQEIDNEVTRHDLEQSWSEAASTEATDTWIDAEHSIDRADQAVWESRLSQDDDV